MLAVFSAPDAVVLAAAVPGVIAAIVAAFNTRSTKKQLKPNGGTSLRDSNDRIERAVQHIHTRLDNVDARLTTVEDFVTKPRGKGQSSTK